MFKSKLHSPHVNAMRKSQLNGLAFGVSQGLMFFAYATGFYFGGYLIQEQEMDFEGVFV